MSKSRPSPFGVALRAFRFRSGLSETEAARVLGLSLAQLSRLERGAEGTLSRARLDELLARFDVPPEATDLVLQGLEMSSFSIPSGSSAEPDPAEWGALRRAAAAAGQGAAEAALGRLTANLRRKKAAKHRRQALSLWQTLKDLPPRRRRLAVESEERYWTWALAERLCEESVRAAAHRASDAVDLSRLGLYAAERSPESEPWRSLLLGWVWAFVANARRVHGDLPGAEEGFLRSDRLLEAGAASSPFPLDATRPLGMKATLRRYQGRFDEALDLLEKAAKMSTSQEARGRIFVYRANTLKLMGEFEEALAEFRRAELLLKDARDTRIVLIVKHSLVHNLWQLGRYSEAEARLPEARRWAIETGNELDLMRVLWVEGGVAAGLGRRDKALMALEQVRQYFNAKRIAYDAALASLELSVLYLEEGRSAEVKRLSEEMYWIFKAQGVHQETLAALQLFFEAAAKEQATADLARRLLEYLTKARCHPGLRFENPEPSTS